MANFSSLHTQNSELNKASSGKKILIGFILLLSVGLNAYFMFFKKAAETQAQVAVAGTEEVDTEENIPRPVAVSSVLESTGSSTPTEAAKQFHVKNTAFTFPDHFEGRPVRSLHFNVKNSLNYSFCSIMTKEDGCELLSAYVTRLLVWSIDITKQIRNQDEVTLIFVETKTEERYAILKLKYTSRYANKTFEADFYKAPEWEYGAFFDQDGNEVAPRIVEKEAPVRDYIEITSLPGEYRAGRFHGHSGTDFKTPVGTPIYSTFDGRVTRVNWNFRSNGDSIEIEHPEKGIMTLYLHLNKVHVKAGDYVKQGQQIADSGNTGRSFAPHLHYEIKKTHTAKKLVFNPFESNHHKTYRRKVAPQQEGEFRKTVALYDSVLRDS